ncbi:MAG: response regulator [Pseudomonadota bacterium]
MTAHLSKVLLVEDDDVDAAVVTRLLTLKAPPSTEITGFEVERRHRLDTALEVATKGDISAILLDLGLPDSQGLDTVRRMLDAAPRLPLLVLTGSDDEQLAIEAVREGAQDYLYKTDLAAHALSRAIEYAIERKQASDSQRRMDQRMLAAQKLESLGVLAGGIAHDFNNLLSSVLGYAALALEQIPEHTPYRRDIEQIQRASQRAAELTRQLLAYSGKGRFVVEAINLSTLVSEMTDLVSLSTQRQVSIRYELAPSLPTVRADATQLRQVVLNLISNAAEASPKNGVVTIFTGSMTIDDAYQRELQLAESVANGEYVFLEISDAGGGMNESTRSRMFDPFYSTKRSGRGLGLAAVLGIVQGHRGAIKVYSQEGKGTTIKVLLPAVDETAANPVSMPGSFEWEGSGTVLVVDDEPDVREVSRAILERFGLTVMVASGGVAGVEMFREHHPEIDAVLLDMTMPDMDGASVFQEIRRIDPGVRVVLTSGYNEQDAVSRFAGKGLAGFLAKPIQLRELGSAFRKILGQ